MNYKKLYNNIIAKYKCEDKPEGYDTHHIIPRSLGGTDEKDNLVNVPTRVHYLLHWLLAKDTKAKPMIDAFHLMSTGKRYNSKGYALARKLKSESMRVNNPMYTIENRKKQGEKMKKNEHKLRSSGKDRSRNRSTTLFGNERNAKKQYQATSPNGEVFVISNMRKFCREYNLNQTCMTRVCKGKLSNHFGWVAIYL